MADDNKVDTSVYSRLKKLFSTGVIVRNVGGKKLKVADTDSLQSTMSNQMRDRYSRIYAGSGYGGVTPASNYSLNMAYQSQRIMLFRDYDIMDMDSIIHCLDGNTRVMTLEGPQTIIDLANRYPNGESFEVWAWDSSVCKYTIGQAHHPRKTGQREVIEIVLDNGKIVKCTPDHRLMLIDGTYKEAGKCSIGEALMPFAYQSGKYMQIRKPIGGYMSAHKYLYENVLDIDTTNKHIHHINHNRWDNRTSNLELKSPEEHMNHHSISSITVQKKSDAALKLWKDDDYRERALSGLKEWQNSEEGHLFMSAHTANLNKKRWATDVDYSAKMVMIFSNHAKSLWANKEWKARKIAAQSYTMKLKFANDPTFVEKTKRIGSENGKYKKEITTEWILANGVNSNTLVGFSKNAVFDSLNTKNVPQFIHRRLKEAGYSSWKDYKETYEYSNHKIAEIRFTNELIDVYDVTVDHFENFAIEEGIIVSNSALDIISDECTVKNEYGRVLTIECDNSQIKEILENLYYDILNIEFNLYMWVRSLCKYGDFFLFMQISPEYGVHNVLPMSVYDTIRLEGLDPKNPYYVVFETMGAGGQKQRLENFEIAHFRLVGDANFLPYGKCCAFNTDIWTPTGMTKIQDVKEGDIIYSFNNDTGQLEKTKVLKQISSGKKKIYEVRTAHRKLRASEYHPVLTSDGIYKPISELNYYDEVILPNCNNINQDIEYPNLILDEVDSKTKILSDVVIKENFTEFVRFFGFLLGDGWLDKSNKTVGFSLGTRLDKSQQYVDFIQSLGLSYRVVEEDTSRASCIIHSVYFYNLLLQLGFKTGSIHKEIPEWIWSLPTNIQKELLYGFADADGTLTKQGGYQVGTINKTLLEALRGIAMRSGLSVTKVWKTQSKEGYWNKQLLPYPMYLFTFRETSRDFIKLSETCHKERVREIISRDEEETYDIQVDSAYSNFIADGVVVHNSYLEGGRRVYRQLMLMEDAMLIHRIMRAPEKRIFKVDIGNIPPGEVDSYIQKLIDRTKKIPFIDPATGEYNLRYNMQNILEDFYLPVRGGDSGTSIENLGGLEYNAIDDIQYLLNRLLASLKIPKAFLGYEEGIAGKLTLASEDVRFARTIERIQRIIESELYKIGVVHLYAQGYTDESLISFKVNLTNPSTIYEQEKVNLWKEKTILARDILDTKMLSTDWIYENLFNIPKDDFNKERELVIADVKRTFRQTQIEQGMSDPTKFGFPQDQPPPELPPEGEMPPEGGGGLPPGGSSPGGNASYGDSPPPPGSPAPQQENAPGAGRPPEGINYGQDNTGKNLLGMQGGRDPLGANVRYHAIGQKRDRHDPKKFPLSFEGKALFGTMIEKNMVKMPKSSPQVLKEEVVDTDTGTFLDESILEIPSEE